jgi:hypothetical protein
MRSRAFFLSSLAFAFALSANVGPTIVAAAELPKSLTIGYQKVGPLLILKDQGLLEKRLASQGIEVKWVQFRRRRAPDLRASLGREVRLRGFHPDARKKQRGLGARRVGN